PNLTGNGPYWIIVPGEKPILPGAGRLKAIWSAIHGVTRPKARKKSCSGSITIRLHSQARLISGILSPTLLIRQRTNNNDIIISISSDKNPDLPATAPNAVFQQMIRHRKKSVFRIPPEKSQVWHQRYLQAIAPDHMELCMTGSSRISSRQKRKADYCCSNKPRRSPAHADEGGLLPPAQRVGAGFVRRRQAA
ncbi:MAG: hypothetical protein M1488_02540, partial [Gammaproteobacteria bacterium]|nr:hypothetical protein [Gammaproteobacteria bacterium]